MTTLSKILPLLNLLGITGAYALDQIVTNTSDSGAGSLRQAIVDVGAGENITFDSTLDGQTITLSSGQLVINKSLTIDASALPNGLTIDANGDVTNHRVLTINSGATANLTKLYITGGKTENFTGFLVTQGGGILNKGSLTLTDCIVSQNTTDVVGDGGGIYCYSSSSSLTLNNSTVTQNSAGSNSDGGGICSESSVTLNHSIISYNYTGRSGDGGGIYSSSVIPGTSLLTLNHSTVSYNYTGNGENGGSGGGCGGEGGGIYASGSTVILNHSTVSYNHTGSGGDGSESFGIGTDGGDGGKGGGIFATSLTLNYSTVSDNYTGNGGDGGDDSFGFDGGDGGDGGGGGGVSAFSLTLNHSTISDNYTGNGGEIGFGADGVDGRGGGGGGISASTVTLNQSTVFGNDTGSGGAGGAGGGISASTVTLNQSTLSDNTTGDSELFGTSGGGIYSSGGNITLENSVVFGNSAGNGIFEGGSGGGIYSKSHNLTLENSVIAGNTTDFSRLNTQGSGPDLFKESGSLNSLGANLISDTSSGISITVPGTVLTGDPLLAPLGNYGGPTLTMPPLPGSPLIDPTGTTTPGGTDQRDLPRTVNTTDIGAVEIQDAADTFTILSTAWPLDADGDGNPYGLELTLGTDPNTPDASHPDNVSAPAISTGNTTLNFGRGTILPGVVLILKRSSTLELGSFQELYRFTGSTMMETLQSDINSTVTPSSFSITDEDPPVGKAFYLIESALE